MKIANNNYFDLKKKKPHSIQAEQSVLGSLLLDNSVWDRISDLLIVDDFYFKNHKIIFSEILKLINSNKLFDVIIIHDILKNLNKTKFSYGIKYLNFLVQKTPIPSNIYYYATIVHNMSILRKLLNNADSIINDICISKYNNVNNLINRIESEIFDISKYYLKEKSNISIIGPIFNKTLNDIELLCNSSNNIIGIPTGFIELDKILSGMHRGELIVVAGRPSMGKTAFSVNIAQYISIKIKLPVIIFSMEMSSSQLAMRILSSISNIDQHIVRSGNLLNKDFLKLKKLVNKIHHIKLFIDESANLTPIEIYSRSKKIIRQYGSLGLIVIDYLQLMSSSNSNQNRVMEISEISRSLKCLAKELNVPIMAISQLNRGLELRSNKRPMMSDLRESGAIEQDADVILFIYRDEIYNPHSLNKGIAEIIISKQRNGPTGIINLSFFDKNLKFKNEDLYK